MESRYSEDPFEFAADNGLGEDLYVAERIEYSVDAINKASGNSYGDRFVTLSSEDVEHLKSGGLLAMGDSEYGWFLRLRKD